MRVALIAAAILALAACDSGSVPPPGQEPLRSSTPQVAEDEVELRGQGLVAGTEAFYFAAGRNEIESATTPILGEPIDVSENFECGSGEMQFTEYSNGLILNFQRGNLVGWNSRDGSGASRAVGDVQVGMLLGDAMAVPGFQLIEDSTLGAEFTLGNAMGGFLEDGKVVMLYAGAQCFFR
ncbi:MAG: aspartate-semialdehyde dehydrogenase [Pseudomonadota bacterium]